VEYVCSFIDIWFFDTITRMVDFDPYYEWLNIPPHEQPVTAHRILGVSAAESDGVSIREAALERVILVRQYSLGQFSEQAENLLNEIAWACSSVLAGNPNAHFDTRNKELLLQQIGNSNAKFDSQIDWGSVNKIDDLPDFISFADSVASANAANANWTQTYKAREPVIVADSFWESYGQLTIIACGFVVVVLFASIVGIVTLSSGTNKPLVSSEESSSTNATQSTTSSRSSTNETERQMGSSEYAPSDEEDGNDVANNYLSQLGTSSPIELDSDDDSSNNGTTLMDDYFTEGNSAMDIGQDPFAPQSPAGSVNSSGKTPMRPTYSNSLGMDFAIVSAGTFKMGSPQTEQGHESTESVHRVEIRKAFLMQCTEVTQEQWQAVMATTPWRGKEGILEGKQYPATYISWDDAMTFCDTLSRNSKRNYRLPTEAEWEYACRAGLNTIRSYGETIGVLDRFAWYIATTTQLQQPYPHPVALKLPNPIGLHDMYGNVQEWCYDWYDGSFYNNNAVDPVGPPTGVTRVLRGGSWEDDITRMRSAHRGHSPPEHRNQFTGFRVVSEFE
jgi:formylglycine-generating enzyme required for sulfatase activity